MRFDLDFFFETRLSETQRKGSTSHLDPKHTHVLRRCARSRRLGIDAPFRSNLVVVDERTNRPTDGRRGMATRASVTVLVLRARLRRHVSFIVDTFNKHFNMRTCDTFR